MIEKQPRIALLIDADNSPASKIDVILAEEIKSAQKEDIVKILQRELPEGKVQDFSEDFEAVMFFKNIYDKPEGQWDAYEMAEKLVDIDETMTDIWLDEPPPPPLAADVGRPDLVLTVGSMSKSFWGGLRIGWIRAEQATLATIAARRPSVDLGTAILVLAAGIYVIFFAGLSWKLILPVLVVGALLPVFG